MRMTFLRWLRHNIFKVPEGETAPKLLWFLYKILFPLRIWYGLSQKHIRWDFEKDTYWIEGVELPGSYITYLKNGGRKFKVEKLAPDA